MISAELTQRVLATSAHLYHPSVMSHLEIASSQCLGEGQWDFRLAPDGSVGSLYTPIEQKIHSVQLWGALEEKVEMEIMTLLGNTRKTLINNIANQ